VHLAASLKSRDARSVMYCSCPGQGHWYGMVARGKRSGRLRAVAVLGHVIDDGGGKKAQTHHTPTQSCDEEECARARAALVCSMGRNSSTLINRCLDCRLNPAKLVRRRLVEARALRSASRSGFHIAASSGTHNIS
jgi:hypothetical protein